MEKVLRELKSEKPLAQALNEIVYGYAVPAPGQLLEQKPLDFEPYCVAVVDEKCLCVTGDPDVQGGQKQQTVRFLRRGDFSLVHTLADNVVARGVAVDQHHIFIAGNAKVAVFEKDVVQDDGKTKTTKTAKTTRLIGEGHLNSSSWLAVGDHDELFVTDAHAEKVMVFNKQSGEFWRRIPGGSRLLCPTGLALDCESHSKKESSQKQKVWVADRDANRVLVINFVTGETLLRIGSQGSGPGQFRAPHGLAIHGQQLFVADTENNRVQVVDKDTGKFVMELGVGKLHAPWGLAIDLFCSGGPVLWVSDRDGLSSFCAFFSVSSSS
jgi:DNA-binding beta-propeller fold protein YncE